jgi:hypothetical protein
MTRLEIEWPDDMAEQIRAARGRLERAGEALRATSLEDRLQSIARVLEDWTAPDSPWRRELTTVFAGVTPFHEDTVREGLEAALRAWKPDDLVECARRELAPVLQSDSLELSPFDWTAVLAGGGIPMPTMQSVLLPLILGSPVLLRETSNDRVTASLLKRSLKAQDETLARSFEHLAFPNNDIAFDVLLEAPCVVATGSDETIQSISSRLRPNQRFVGFGHRFSIGVVGPALGIGEGSIQQIAEGFALDVACWDQTGCLSPIVVYLVGLESSAELEIAREIAAALERISGRMPRGEISTAVAASHANERAEARMRHASGDTMLFEGESFSVVLETNTQPRPAPLYRFLRLMPVRSLDGLKRALEPFGAHLSNVAIAGFTPDEHRALRQRLARFGASRSTEPGRLQTPPIDWPHDGMPVFTPLARFTQWHSLGRPEISS